MRLPRSLASLFALLLFLGLVVSGARAAEKPLVAVFLYDGKLPEQVALEAVVKKLVAEHADKVALRTMHAGRAETVPFLKRHGFTRKNAPLLLLMDGPGENAKIQRKVYVDPAQSEQRTVRLVSSVLKLPRPPAEHPKPGPVVTIVPDGGAAEKKLLVSAVGSQRVTRVGRWLDTNGILTYRVQVPDELRYADLHAEIGGSFAVDWADDPRGRWTSLMDSHRYFGAAADTVSTRVSPVSSLDEVLPKLTGDLYLRVRSNGQGRNQVFFARMEVVARAPGAESAEGAWLREAEQLRDARLRELVPNRESHTPLSGTVDRNTRLTVERSPYLLQGDLLVAPNATLTVDPGVTVHVVGNCAIRVQGQLVAKGSAALPILFSPSTPRQADDWKGIAFAPLPNRPAGNASVLEYCRIVNAANVDLPQFAGEIAHCIIEGGLTGITLRSGGTGRIHHNRFLRCRRGLVVNQGTGEVTENEWLECHIATAFASTGGSVFPRFERNSLVRSRVSAVNYLKTPGREMPRLSLPHNHWSETPPEKLIGGGADAGPVTLEPRLDSAPEGVGPRW